VRRRRRTWRRCQREEKRRRVVTRTDGAHAREQGEPQKHTVTQLLVARQGVRSAKQRARGWGVGKGRRSSCAESFSLLQLQPEVTFPLLPA
jgi:hypothetical protein